MNSLDDVVICCLTRDRISQEFTQKTIDHINRRSKSKTHPEVEDAFAAGSFSGGEFHPKFREDTGDLEGKNIYLLGIPTVPMGYRNKVTPGELMNRATSAAQVAYDCGAANVFAIFTNLMFARADKRQSDFKEETEAYDKNAGTGRVLLSQIKNLWANDVKGILTVDHHSDSLFNFTKQVYGIEGIAQSLDTNPLTAHYLVNESLVKNQITANQGLDLVLVAADKGIKEKINNLMNILQTTYRLENVSALYLDKFRKHPNNPNELLIRVNKEEPHSPNFTSLINKIILILDDIVDTAGTFEKALGHIFKKGIECNGSGYEKPLGAIGMFTHPVLAGISYDEPMKKLLSADLLDLAVYNTHPFIEEKMLYNLKKKATTIRLAKSIAESIILNEQGKDINSMFYTDGQVDIKKVESLYNHRRSSSHILNN